MIKLREMTIEQQDHLIEEIVSNDELFALIIRSVDCETAMSFFAPDEIETAIFKYLENANLEIVRDEDY